MTRIKKKEMVKQKKDKESRRKKIEDERRNILVFKY